MSRERQIASPTVRAGPTRDARGPAMLNDPIDSRAVRVGVASSSRLEGDPAITVAPAPDPAARPLQDGFAGLDLPHIDGAATAVSLERIGEVHAELVESAVAGVAGPDVRTSVRLGPVRIDRASGTRLREVVVDGWRIDVELESERRAVLREQARGRVGAALRGGPVEVRAIIPGCVVAISVAAGDSVGAGQQVLVVEAMKMQNEVRAPRQGTVKRVGVAVGDTIDVGDLLIVIH